MVAKKVLSARAARLIPWTVVVLVMMSLLALALPDIELTQVATLESWANVTDIFRRNLPDEWSGPLLFETQALRFTFQLAGLCYLDTVSARARAAHKFARAHALHAMRM